MIHVRQDNVILAARDALEMRRRYRATVPICGIGPEKIIFLRPSADFRVRLPIAQLARIRRIIFYINLERTRVRAKYRELSNKRNMFCR